MPLSTVFRSENAERGFPEARELSAATGLSPFDLVAFRPERLVAHEVLIRCTADLRIPDGPRYAELGVNLREMVATILDRHVAPRDGRPRGPVRRVRGRRDATAARGDRVLAEAPRSPPSEPAPRALDVFAPPGSRGAAPEPPAPPPEDDMERALSALADWSRRAEAAADPVEAACLSALAWAAGAVARTRGRLPADPDLLVGLARARVRNETRQRRRSRRRSRRSFSGACAAEGYELLPPAGRALHHERQGRLGLGQEHDAVAFSASWRKGSASRGGTSP